MSNIKPTPKTLYKSDTYLGLCPSTIDWARLAAYIDGEGSINLSPRYTNTGDTLTLCGRVQVTNTDFRLAYWLAKTFEMKYYSHPTHRKNPDKWKPCVFAQASGYRAAWICYNTLPWFLLKRNQAEIILEHQETMGSFKRGSGIKTPPNVLEFRSVLREKMHELNKRGPRAKVAEDQVS